jgi:hypothetical protein
MAMNAPTSIDKAVKIVGFVLMAAGVVMAARVVLPVLRSM